jgi:hypothetical protein
VLKAQAFEGLFTLVPVLLFVVVSVVLRTRASRKRKKREEAARGETAGGTPARGAQARSAPVGGAPVRGAPAEAGGGMKPPSASRTAGFGQEAPIAQQRTVRPQVFHQEVYAYPPPLALNEDGSPVRTDHRPRGGPAILRPAAGPSAESRMAIDRMAVQRGAKSLQERMAARGKTDSMTTGAAAGAVAGKRSSITARLERLPPLKRAVVWAEILGPPGGRQ